MATDARHPTDDQPCPSPSSPAQPGTSADQTAMQKLFGEMINRGFVGNVQLMWQNGLLWTTWSLLMKLFTFIVLYRNIRYDKKHNVNTASLIRQSDIDVVSLNNTQGIGYVPTSEKVVRSIMASLPADLSPYTFVDFGCGKGKVLFIASEYNFSRIIGIEYSCYLSHSAMRNIHSYRSNNQKCYDLQCIYIDATEFTLPTGCCVLYFFAPFSNKLFTKILDNLTKRHRDDHILICYSDDIDDKLLSRGTKAGARLIDSERHPINEVGGICERYGFTCRVRRTRVQFDWGAERSMEFVVYERGLGVIAAKSSGCRQ